MDIIPQWPVTETIFKVAFISAEVTAFKKWPGTSARQSLQGERLQRMAARFTKAQVMDEMGIALGQLDCWFKQLER